MVVRGLKSFIFEEVMLFEIFENITPLKIAHYTICSSLFYMSCVLTYMYAMLDCSHARYTV